MPVILENGSDAMRTWLDPKRNEWDKELQSLLKPFQGDLECYPVIKDVGKVGNNSPDFIVPVSQNKGNIANFFANAKKPNQSENHQEEKKPALKESDIKLESNEDHRITADPPRSEDNAPVPKPESSPEKGVKRSLDDEEPKDQEPQEKAKTKASSPPSRTQSPVKKKLRSATSNGTVPKSSPAKAGSGNQRITSFFNK